jgi:hypothetical protein
MAAIGVAPLRLLDDARVLAKFGTVAGEGEKNRKPETALLMVVLPR